MNVRSVARMVAILAASLATTPVEAAIQAVAVTGDSTPEANGLFGTFSVTNATAPVLNNSGELAFWAGLVNSSGGFDDDTGIYFYDGAELRNVIRENGSVPEGEGRFNVLSDVPSLNSAGQVAFDSSLRNVSFDTNVGSYLYDGASLNKLARRGEPLPDGNGLFSQSLNTTVNAVGHVRIKANLTGTLEGANNDLGMYLFNGSGLVKLARENETVPESNGVFSDFFDFKQGFNDADQVAFHANLRQTSGGASDDEGIYLHNGAALLNLARENTPAPEGNGLFASFSASALLNSAGQVAFSATLRNTAGGTLDNSGIYLNDGAALQKVAREGQTVPETDAQFADFDFPVVNDAGQIAFTAYLRNNSGGNATDSGIYTYNGAGLVKYLRENDILPDGNGRFDTFNRIQLNAAGQVAFKAYLRGTSGGLSDDNGLYVTDGIETVKVAREGDVLEGSPITFLDTTGGYAGDLGLRDSFNDFGQVAFRAARANGSQGIFLFTPELRWRSTSGGFWDTAANWTLSLLPGAPHNVTINPVAQALITGPAGDVALNSLTLGDGIHPAGPTLALLAGSAIHAVEAIQLKSDATISFEIGGVDFSEFARLTSDGIASLDGKFTLELINGFQPGVGNSFSILSASGGLDGTFDTVADELPALSGGHRWEVNYGANEVVLSVVSGGVPGDTNADGLVDLTDLNNVRNNFGGTGLGDTDADNDVDLDDLNAVRNNFGSGGANPVPEPTSLALLALGAVGIVVRRRVVRQ